MAQDIIFKCPHCEQWLESPPDMAGLFVECPKCEAIIKVPTAAGEASITACAGKPRETPAEKSEADSLKGSTIRINLPPNMGLPPAVPKRRIILRRSS